MPALSKIIERVYLEQLIKHLDQNKLIGHQHHGAIKGKSTQTLISELHDNLMEDDTKGQESALLILDQSKAYNLVSHDLLLKKLEIIGFQPQALRIMKSFLENRKQYVQVDGFRSENLMVGPNSVVQGSVLSCTLYLIFILDLPELFHNEKHDPIQDRNCKKTSIKTFIDDTYLKANKEPNKDLTTTVRENMDKMEEYTKGNQLALNSEKTKIILFTKDKEYKDNFSITLNNKEVKHQNEALILGNIFSENLTWESHIKKD